MIQGRWYTNPLFVFIFSLIALGTSLFLYIHSYLRVNKAFSKFVKERNLDASKFLDTDTWVMILILSLLVAIILAGLAIIFVYYQKMIQLYRMQQNFINGFTHELKTPIASLRLFLETFSRHELPRDQQFKYLDYMKRDTERLSENVNLILNLSKIEEKKYKGEWVVDDLGAFFNQWLVRSNFLFEELEIDWKKPDEPFISKFDPQLMEMVFMNLVTNSVHYNDKPNPKLKVSLIEKEKHLVMSFHDNGMGIAKKDQKLIFKKFFQVRPSGKGSGIGLYMVQQVMRMHKGAVKVFSEGPDEGSTFILQLPRESLS